MLNEARFAIRSLLRERGYTAVSIVLLSLGIGLCTAVFTLLWQVVYASLAVPDPAQLYMLAINVNHNGRSESDARADTFSWPTYRYLASKFTQASGIAARHGSFINIETPHGPEHLPAEFVSGNFFHTLATQPVLGRSITPADDTASDSRFVLVLSYDFWQSAFGAQPTALNMMVRVNGVPFRVVGVAHKNFNGLIAGKEPRIYIPLSAFDAVTPGWNEYTNWSFRWLNVITRLPAKISQPDAETAIQPVYQAAVRQELASGPAQSPEYLKELAHEHMSLLPASKGIDAAGNDWSAPLVVLQLMAVAVLLLTAFNVAGLTIVRAIKQRQQVLIRYALGASRTAMMRLYLLQTLILSIASGMAAVWLSRIAAHLLIHLERMDRNGPVSLNTFPSLVFEAVCIVGAALLIGVFPALYAAQASLSAGLNEASTSHSIGRSPVFFRRAMAALQIALSLVLVIAAALFAKSLHALVSVPVGFDPDHLMVFSIDARLRGVTNDFARQLYLRVAQRLKELPGVLSVSYGTGGPFPSDADATLIAPGSNIQAPGQRSAVKSVVGAEYFHTLGMRLAAGREFDSRDRGGASLSVIINETLAKRLFPNSASVGQQVTLFSGVGSQSAATIIGVVADSRLSWRRPTGSLLYTAADQASTIQQINFYVRTSPGASLNDSQIRQLLNGVMPGLSAFDIVSMPARMEGFASGERAMTLLTAVFAGLAFLIAIVGIYGVVSYSAALRTLEFGVRLSIGALPSHVFALVLREAALIAIAGIALAAPLGWFGLCLIRTQLLSISPDQPVIYCVAALLLCLASLAAAFFPARRAATMDPLRALRYE